jgi:phage I-like protein
VPKDSIELPADCVELHAMPLHAHAEADDDGLLPVPEWVHIAPAGEPIEGEGENLERVVRGRDGREFAVADPGAVIAATELPMQFDWDHESMSYFGGSTRAAGWLDAVEYVDEDGVDEDRPEPGFWAHVERWTPKGREDVERGYYRGLSPVIRHQLREPEVEGDDPPAPMLLGFINVALTNRPNLRMALLNSEGAPSPSTETNEETMNTIPEELHAAASAVGLDPSEATPAQFAEALAPRLSVDDSALRAELAAAQDAHSVLATDLEAARAELATYRAKERDEVIGHAIRSGRTSAGNREMLERLYTTDRAAFDTLTGGTAAPTPIVEQVTSEAGSANALLTLEDLSPREQLFARSIKAQGLRGEDGKPLSGVSLYQKAQEMAKR